MILKKKQLETYSHFINIKINLYKVFCRINLKFEILYININI